MSKSYQVKLDGFEGPLDLLLHLIHRYEIDIYDIPVAKITDQYMQFIHTMKKLELDVASEYLVMAATLLAMKSQMLLPNQDAEVLDEEELEEDPREDLMKKLIEYRKYKQAADELKQKEVQANRIYTRPPMSRETMDQDPPEIQPGEASIYDMLQAMGNLLSRTKHQAPLDKKVKRDEIPIQLRMDEIMDKIRVNERGTKFTQLFEKPTRPHIVVTFMALLELMKTNDVVCIQNHQFEELMVYPKMN